MSSLPYIPTVGVLAVVLTPSCMAGSSSPLSELDVCKSSTFNSRSVKDGTGLEDSRAPQSPEGVLGFSRVNPSPHSGWPHLALGAQRAQYCEVGVTVANVMQKRGGSEETVIPTLDGKRSCDERDFGGRGGELKKSGRGAGG